MDTKFYLIIVFSLTIMTCKAQFKVLYIIGDVQYKAPNASQWVKCDIHSNLKENTLIKVGKKSNVVILEESARGRSFGVGIYELKINIFLGSLTKNSNNITKNYFSLLWEKLVEHGDNISDYNHLYMVKKGAISRSKCQMTLKSPIWGENIVTNDKVNFDWEKSESADYDFKLLNSKDSTLFNLKLTSNNISISSPSFNSSESYTCSISGKDQCILSPFKISTIEQFNSAAKQLRYDLKGIKNKIFKELLKAQALENQGYFQEVLEIFDSLLKKYPNNAGIINLYNRFKARIYTNYEFKKLSL